MAEWIPLLQSMVWPLFIVAVILRFRGSFAFILTALAERVRSGAPVEVGPGGLKIDEVQMPGPPAADTAPDTREVDSLPHTMYMTHQSRRDPTLDRGGFMYYRLRISLDADEPEMLDDVEKVVYHLHPTFKNPDRTASDRRNGFVIQTAAWGEFNMTAEVFFRSEKPKLVIERYINFLPIGG